MSPRAKIKLWKIIYFNWQGRRAAEMFKEPSPALEGSALSSRYRSPEGGGGWSLNSRYKSAEGGVKGGGGALSSRYRCPEGGGEREGRGEPSVPGKDHRMREWGGWALSSRCRSPEGGSNGGWALSSRYRSKSILSSRLI